MGKRSVKATKSGKFMNPTDQARKEARKKELKKNKKQRLLVRTSVLKNKDPGVIIEELDKLDELEYNVNDAPQLAEKVLKDKRRKLKETLDRVMKLYQKEEPTYWNELKQIEAEYERRRFHRIQHYEAVKQAEAVSNVEDIPLPPTEDLESSVVLPQPVIAVDQPKIPPGILKSTPSIIQGAATHYLAPDGQEPPGVPSGQPPEFSDSEDEESGGEDEDTKIEMNIPFDVPFTSSTTTGSTDSELASPTEPSKRSKTVRFDTASDTSAVEEMDRFMKEVEQELHFMKEDDVRPPGVDNDKFHVSTRSEAYTPSQERVNTDMTVNIIENTRVNQTLNTMRPPPPYFVVGSRPFFPFPPPPLTCGAMTVPPRPPPPPPARLRFTSNSRVRHIPPPKVLPCLAPVTLPTTKIGEAKIVSEAMIQAKPQIRSLSADVTRFVPVAVKTRRDDQGSSKDWQQNTVHPPVKSLQTTNASKDAAYEDFMREMQSLL